jgi:hypothetical protein
MNEIRGLSKNGMLTASELSFRFGVSRQTIYNWIRAGWIPAQFDNKVTFMYYIKEVDLDEILNVGHKWFPGMPISKLPEAVYKMKQVLAAKEHQENA